MILHLRRCPRCCFHPRQRAKESLPRRRRRKERNVETGECASLVFSLFLCVSSTFKDVCLFPSVSVCVSACLCGWNCVKEKGDWGGTSGSGEGDRQVKCKGAEG